MDTDYTEFVKRYNQIIQDYNEDKIGYRDRDYYLDDLIAEFELAEKLFNQCNILG